MTLKIFIFALLALFIVLMFKRSFRSLRTHGFYMFFAFEALLVLLFFNIDFLFEGDFSWYGTLSWVSLVASALLAFSGFYGLKKYGEPVEGWEETTQLIAKGVFRYIRHPLYTSLSLLAIGIFLKHVTLPSFIVFFVATSFLVTASLVEEKENTAKFGSTYRAYAKTSKRYIPFVF
jgi:protein-S-isoprenylcysteine O-methyltransferase Ste14